MLRNAQKSCQRSCRINPQTVFERVPNEIIEGILEIITERSNILPEKSSMNLPTELLKKKKNKRQTSKVFPKAILKIIKETPKGIGETNSIGIV